MNVLWCLGGLRTWPLRSRSLEADAVGWAAMTGAGERKRGVVGKKTDVASTGGGWKNQIVGNPISEYCLDTCVFE